MVVARLVVPVAVGREGSKRSAVAADPGRTMTMEWTLEGDSPRHRERRACLAQWNKISTPVGQLVVALRKRWTGVGRWSLRAVKSAARGGNERDSGHRHLTEES